MDYYFKTTVCSKAFIIIASLAYVLPVPYQKAEEEGHECLHQNRFSLYLIPNFFSLQHDEECNMEIIFRGHG